MLEISREALDDMPTDPIQRDNSKQNFRKWIETQLAKYQLPDEKWSLTS